jgi:predicted helicase
MSFTCGEMRSSGELRRKERDNVFGQGSRAAVAITLLVKNPNANRQGRISFHDVGDYLTRDEKLAIVSSFGSIGGMERANEWQPIIPDEHGDWLKQRDSSFEAFIVLGDKKGNEPKLFDNFSLGIASGRDSWAYNHSKRTVADNTRAMISFYNEEIDRFDAAHPRADRKTRTAAVDGFISTDPARISWTRALKGDLAKDKRFAFDAACLTPSLYRPFMRQWLYYSRTFNEMVYQIPRIFPTSSSENRAICIAGPGSISGFTSLMTDLPPELCLATMKGGTQVFPLYLYDAGAATTNDDAQGDLLAVGADTEDGWQRRDAITDEGLAHFQSAYPEETITKDDVFYYVYGLLHSEDYRARFADNLSKQLPRIPTIKRVADFWAFVQAGRKLGDLHCQYEAVEPYPVTFAQGDLRLTTISDPKGFYRVEQMRFGGKRPKLDKSTVIYNANITMTDIPLDAYDYVVNGRPALEWVMERQSVKTDKASGIVNDANRYAIETTGDPAYPLKLFQRVITVSLETMKIVRALPTLGDLA